MSAKIINGKEIAAQIYKELEKEIKLLKSKAGITPGLAVVVVGEDPASQIYVRNKKRICETLGIYSEEYRFMAHTLSQDIIRVVEQLNYNPAIHGILVQLPLPAGIDPMEVQNTVSPNKDADGFHPENMGRLLMGEARFVPCTPLGIQELLIRNNIAISGKRVVIVGRSNIVSKPLAALLMQKKENANATVTVCHSRTKDLAEITRKADILVAAIGRPEFITADMVADGAVVIDVGMNRLEGRLTGDVHFPGVSEKASYITPVPKGVGPVTIAMLMHNTVKAAKLQISV